MSKKHFIAIAGAIAGELDKARTLRDNARASDEDRIEADGKIEALGDVAIRLASEFGCFNENFDRQRFLKACGVITVA